MQTEKGISTVNNEKGHFLDQFHFIDEIEIFQRWKVDVGCMRSVARVWRFVCVRLAISI